MPVKTLNMICPKCRHVYETLRSTAICPACEHRPRAVLDLSEFGPHESAWPFVLGLLAVAGAIAALFGLGVI
jgi:hypothetical protein